MTSISGPLTSSPSRVSGAVDQIVHAVEAAEKRRFAAAGRPDERRGQAAHNVEIDAGERLLPAIEEIEIRRLHDSAVYSLLRLHRNQNPFIAYFSRMRLLRLMAAKLRTKTRTSNTSAVRYTSGLEASTFGD